MEQLIDFLFKHWYLVIIGLTFLYQMQSKSRRAKPKPSKSGMPTFGGAPGEGQKPSTASRHEKKGVNPVTPPRGSHDEYGRSNTPKVAAASGPKSSPFNSPKSLGMDSSSVYAGDLTSPSPFPDSPSQEQLLQGVVWSEILGPPRSKKPFRN